ARQYSGSLAARGEGAAGGTRATHRVLAFIRRARSRSASTRCCLSAGTRGAWLDREPQYPARASLRRWVDQIQTYTREVVRSAPDVIVCSSTPIVAALKQATDTIPIVFSLVNDPVGQGFVATLPRPGDNITGFSFIDFPLIGKWIEMLKEIAPGIRRTMLIFNPNTSPYYTVFLREFGAAPASLAVELSASPVHDEAEREAAIKTFAREPGSSLIAAADVFINTRRRLIMALAEQHGLPVIYPFRQFVAE